MARHFGLKVPLKNLRELCDVNRQGVSIADILSALEAVRMKGTAVRIGMEDFWRMPLPAILFWNNNHFVVAYRSDREKGKVWIADPSEGRVKLTEEEFRNGWIGKGERGIAVLAAPDEGFESQKFSGQKGDRGLWKMIGGILRGNRWPFAVILVLTVIGMLADIGVPLLFQRTVDDGIMSRDISLVWLLIAGQFAFFAGSFVADSILEIMVTRLGLKLNIGMVSRYLSRLVSMPLSFFDRKVNSDLIQKIDDQTRLKDFILSLPQSLFLMVANMLVFSGMLCWYSPEIFIIFLLLSLIELVWTLSFLPRQKRLDYSFFNRLSENRNNIYELVNGMADIKSNGAQQTKVGQWHDTQKQINRLSMKNALLGIVSGGGAGFIGRIKDLLVTAICAVTVIDGGMTIGIMMTVGYITGRLSGPFRSLLSMASNVQGAHISYERLDEVMESPDAITPGAVVPSQYDMELYNVRFRYPGGNSPFVLDGLSLVIPAGKTTALVGESGCGKTTLIKLLLGFYLPSEGRLRVGGIDADRADRDSWIARCGTVLQSGYIFSGTIAENIALSDTEPDMDRVRIAAKTAVIDGFIESLPMGYHTVVGATGLELSGGQRQRLLIARAVYKNPPILFMDEATSSLDANTERLITKNMRRFNSGRTVVVAAHRLSTVKDADNIVFIKGGRIAEQGTHEQLIRLRGEYYNLVKNQLDLAD